MSSELQKNIDNIIEDNLATPNGKSTNKLIKLNNSPKISVCRMTFKNTNKYSPKPDGPAVLLRRINQKIRLADLNANIYTCDKHGWQSYVSPCQDCMQENSSKPAEVEAHV